jgi:hypothetical protein
MRKLEVDFTGVGGGDHVEGIERCRDSRRQVRGGWRWQRRGGRGGEVGPHGVKGTTWSTARLVGFATVARQRGCGMRTRVIGILQCRRQWLEPRQFRQRTGSWQSATR